MTVIRWENADDLPVTKGKSSPFSAKLTSTLDLLDREAFMLGADAVEVFTSHLTSERLRDGQPGRRGATVFGAVRVALTSRKAGRLSWTGSTYSEWEDNLRAVALTMEKLRAIDRYGATHGEQYAGFAALPAGDGGTRARAMIAEAAGVDLLGSVDGHLTDQQLVRRAIRATHPDVNEGDRSRYDQVVAAARDLGVTL